MGRAATSCDPCDARGTVAAIVCILLTVILWCGAFAVDVGSLYADRRRAQSAADLAAMAAAADLARAEDAARATLLDNGVGSMSAFELVTGRYRDLAIGEPMQGSAWYTVGEEGATVRTAQTRLRLVATIGGSGPLAGIAVRVPLYLELASAEARLAAIACGSSPGETRVDIAARPALAGLWLGELDPTALSNFARRPQITPARLIRAPLLRVDGEAHAEITNASETTLSFDRDDIDAGAVKTTATDDALQTLLDGLVRNLDIRVTILGLGLGLPGPVKAAVANLLATTFRFSMASSSRC